MWYYVIVHTLFLSFYYKIRGFIFASLTIPHYCSVFEHVETYLSVHYNGRQIELDDESRITIARNTTTWIKYEGFLLGIFCSIEEGSSSGRFRKYIIMALRRSTLEKFIKDLQKKNNIIDLVQVRTCGPYDWNLKTYPSRKPESIFKPAPIDEMITDALKFMESKERYMNLSIPYRRGYLLDGFPGTGKSTCALCLASVLKKQLYFVSLTYKNADDEWLIDILSRVPAGSIILFDDFDRFVPSEKNGITIGGLLNALDGVVAQTGKIIIIIANDISRIPEALLRPGRIDRRFTFELTTTKDAVTLFERFHGKEYTDLFIQNFKSPQSASAIVSYLMMYEDGKTAALNACSIG
jgi:hypothetical protein